MNPGDLCFDSKRSVFDRNYVHMIHIESSLGPLEEQVVAVCFVILELNDMLSDRGSKMLEITSDRG